MRKKQKSLTWIAGTKLFEAIICCLPGCSLAKRCNMKWQNQSSKLGTLAQEAGSQAKTHSRALFLIMLWELKAFIYLSSDLSEKPLRLHRKQYFCPSAGRTTGIGSWFAILWNPTGVCLDFSEKLTCNCKLMSAAEEIIKQATLVSPSVERGPWFMA